MNYHSVGLRGMTSTEVQPNIEAIDLRYSIPVVELKKLFPNVKAIQLDSAGRKNRLDLKPDYLEQLCAAYAFESFSLCTDGFRAKPPLILLWQPTLRNLKILYLYSQLDIILPFNFKNNLEEIELKGTRSSSIPAALFRTDSLKSIHVNDISKGLSGINGARNVEKIVIYGFSDKKLPFDIANLPNLKHFSLNVMELESLPDFRFLEQLEYLELSVLQHLKTLENHWDVLQKLNTLILNCTLNTGDNTLFFNELSKLNTLFISHFCISERHLFLGKMPVLETIKLRNVDVNTKQLSDALLASSILKTVEIIDGLYLTELPTIILTNPNLAHLTILNCKNLKMPREILIKEGLEQFDYDFPHYQPSKLSETPFKDNLLKILDGVPAAQRLALGHLLFGGSDAIWDEVEFKDAFLHLLNIKNAIMKRLVHENLHLLNPHQKKIGIPTDYQGKTIAFAGTTHKLKSNYKQKLIALSIDYQSVVQPDTNWLIIGNSIALPKNFWNYPHYFLTEQDLEAFLTETNPDFLQHVEQPIAENIQALLFTNDVGNEQIVVEMVRSGGIPTHLVPDLLLVAKTSADATVRKTLKKILKAQLPPDVQRILLDQHQLDSWRVNHFERFQEFAPNFDVAQMIYCHYKRTKGKGGWDLVGQFLKASQYRANPNRAEMFEIEAQSLFYDTTILDFRRFDFNPDEIRSILDNPRFGDLKSLTTNMNDIPFATLLKFKRLKHMSLYGAKEMVLPEEIGQLIHLESIYIRCETLKTLPINLLALPVLETLSISVDTESAEIRLPIVFRTLRERLKHFEIQPEPIYE